MKLNMGCGPDRKDGWVNVDIRTDVPVDIDYDISKTPYDFAKNIQMDEILFNHSMEHLPFNCHSAIMAECLRLLKPGGMLMICVPDLKDFVKNFQHYIFETAYTANEDKRIADAKMFWDRFSNVINGEQLHPNDMHISTFDYGYYLMKLKEVGFDTVWEEYDSRGLVIKAFKGVA